MGKDREHEHDPLDPVVNTQVMPEDLEPVKGEVTSKGVDWSEVEDAVVVTNPDISSMDSRG